MKKLIFSIVLIGLLFSGCGSSGKSDTSELVGAEFNTLSSCLEAIKNKNGGGKMKPMTDTPELVTGYLSNGEQFGCEKKISGTKGVYFSGWYYKLKWILFRYK